MGDLDALDLLLDAVAEATERAWKRHAEAPTPETRAALHELLEMEERLKGPVTGGDLSQDVTMRAASYTARTDTDTI